MSTIGFIKRNPVFTCFSLAFVISWGLIVILAGPSNIPIDAEQNTWLVGQYRYTLNEYSWEIPMGGVPLSEDTLEGAKRELQEETGLTAQKWTRLFRIHTSNSVTDEYGYVYLAEKLEQGETDWDETEELLIKKMPLKEAISLVEAGKITDSLSISGLLMIGRKLGL